MKKTPFILIVLSILIGCGNIDKKAHHDVPHIYIDVDSTEHYMDLTEFLDTSFYRVIPLETTPECLVGNEIQKVFYRNGRIYVWEEQSKGVFMFDENGNYLNKIQTPGEGPQDYIAIHNVCITDEYIYIRDVYGHKVLYYDLDCNFIKSISTKEINRNIITPSLSFVAGNRVYFGVLFLDNYPKRLGQPYKWVSLDMDLDTGSVKRFMPYDPTDPSIPASHFSPLSSGTNYTYMNCGDTVRFMISNLDTIYIATRDTIVPEYVVDFGDKTLPESLRHCTFQEKREKDEYDNYVLGIRGIYDTKDYLILTFHWGDYSMKEIMAALPEEIRDDRDKKELWIRNHRPTRECVLILNKKTGETRLTNGINIPMFMEYPFMFKFHDGQYIISAMSVFDGLFDKDGNARVYKTPESPGYQRALKEAYSKLTPMSNPILFIYKFKDVE
ncbi:MAG: 6-bladed beta-propeller [Flavobacteriales bacterium]|nr:6-bladed beta-propeller [Flavobacteriales bacterium]